jgi:hypothetical protein
MRKYLIYNLAALALAVGSLISCDAPDQEVSPVISPDTKPMATFTANMSTTSVEEGDTLILTITTDKMIERALTFAPIIEGGTADELDYTIVGSAGTSAVLAPYTNSIQMLIIFTEDNFPEVSEDLQLEIGVYSIAEKYLLHPDYENLALDLTITNKNDPTALTIAFGWPNHDEDIDLFSFFGTEAWGAAASSDNPEIDRSIWTTDPDGTYYSGIDPYDVTGDPIEYTVSLGYPDGTVEFLTGTFDPQNLDAYTQDYFEPWDIYTYRILEIEKTGETYDVTHVIPVK